MSSPVRDIDHEGAIARIVSPGLSFGGMIVSKRIPHDTFPRLRSVG